MSTTSQSFLASVIVLVVFAAVSALVSWIAGMMFNFIMMETSHPGAKISFLVAWAGVLLIGLVLGFYRAIGAMFSSTT